MLRNAALLSYPENGRKKYSYKIKIRFIAFRPLWSPKVYYCIHSSQPLVHILNHTNSVHTFTPYSLISILIL
jgi:hypothetical protein